MSSQSSENTQKKDVDETWGYRNLLTFIAKKCIKNKWYRKNSSDYHDCVHFFTHYEMNEMNKKFNTKFELGSYTYLYKNINDRSQYEGFIRLYVEGCNPKWSFELNKNNEFEIYMA
jgi:hypothetical protein